MASATWTTTASEGPLTRTEGPHLAMLEWRAEDPDQIASVLAANPASWVTAEGLREQRDAVHPLAFKRYHANVWTGGDAPFIMAEEWDGCAGEPDIPEGSEVILGLDASIRHDSTAVCVVRKDGDGVYHVMWKVWTPSKGTEVSLDEVEQFVRELADYFTVRTCVHDRHYFWHAGQRLDDQGIPMVEWPYIRNAAAARVVRDLITHQRLRHGGDDVARRHALAAEVRERENGLIISKRASREPIDALVALSMAVQYAECLPEKKVSIYESYYREAVA